MEVNHPAVIIYLGIYVLALTAGIIRRNTFPLVDSLGVMVIVGLFYTAVVYLIVPASPVVPAPPAGPGQVLFLLAYLAFLAVILILDVPPWLPKYWRQDFIRNQIGTLIYKLLVFVFLPLGFLQLIWDIPLPDFGFRSGTFLLQIRYGVVLAVLLGGISLLINSDARLIRKGKYPVKTLALGMGVTFLWNLLLTGVVEEMFFRGILQARFSSLFQSPAAGIASASLLFGLAHAPGMFLRSHKREGPLGEDPHLIDSIMYAVIALSATGWFMGLLYWRTQSLLVPIIVHAGIDTASSTVRYMEGLGIA